MIRDAWRLATVLHVQLYYVCIVDSENKFHWALSNCEKMIVRCIHCAQKIVMAMWQSQSLFELSLNVLASGAKKEPPIRLFE